MNCFSSLNPRDSRNGLMSGDTKCGYLLSLCLVCCTACGAPASESRAPSDPLVYRIEYVVRPHRADGTVEVALNLSQSRNLLATSSSTMRILIT